jgi:hypothetical protein|eukprot:COSAG06_NODE_405_length_16132_cov_9.166532_17_plen_46_part_00
MGTINDFKKTPPWTGLGRELIHDMRVCCLQKRFKHTEYDDRSRAR